MQFLSAREEPFTFLQKPVSSQSYDQDRQSLKISPSSFIFVSAASTLIQVLSEWVLLEKSLTLTRNALTEPTLYSLDEENRRRFPASPAYDVLITVVNPDPEKLKVAWDLRVMAEGG